VAKLDIQDRMVRLARLDSERLAHKASRAILVQQDHRVHLVLLVLRV
jgi:hypothetical protein